MVRGVRVLRWLRNSRLTLDVWRNSALLLATLMAALFLSTSCAPAVRTPTPEPKGGDGELRIVLPGEPTSLNPDLRTDDLAFIVAQNIYNKLVTLDADYRVIPDLAERWTVSEGGLTYTFHLAKNVRWHDGQPFTSADVKWTFETIVSAKGAAVDVANRIASIDTPDTDTAVVRLKKVWSPFIPFLSWYGTFVLPKHIYEGSDWSTQAANEKPIGTGPFKFVDWVKGERIGLEANKDYFRRGPFLDRVTYRILKDVAKVNDLLSTGEIDYTLALPPRERIAELRRAPGVRVQTFAHPARYFVGFNLRRPPLDDLRVRQAINMAIDRPALVDRALLGYGAPAIGFYTPAVTWAYNPRATVPAFETDGAQRLLDEAGLTRAQDGTRLKLDLLTIEVSPFKDLANALREQLRAVGIEVNVSALTFNDWNRRVYQERDFSLALTNGSHGPDPENLSLRFRSDAPNQFMGYRSPEFDAAVAEGAGRTLAQDRAQAYFRAQEILARDLPLAPLAENVQFIVARDNIVGLPQTEARGLVTFNDFSLVRVKR